MRARSLSRLPTFLLGVTSSRSIAKKTGFPLKIKTATHPDAKALDEVLLWVPIVEGVFNAFCECTFVGLN